ncbi:DUF6268 family outer membrane beta-barrel protein [Robiginitalea marina]|uniref:DUF6268 family outer membrane beta-barrel protein n=1 Tax=Robiginitalea marina TaxID=2954105 RepID=A0ABT1AY30_9FLAO|nr:DUF6268 family outer membrane beta-barrel protein [Robiginitalea marina]MCO5724123.1 DUF6268 family outer membrane beta-barrel protein [Robiginitalea marina]
MVPGKHLALAILLFITAAAPAQEEGPEEEFDFSNLVPAEDIKAFCSPRILNGGPQNLFSIGYDVQGTHDLAAGGYQGFPDQDIEVNRIREFRIDAQYPVISKNNITVNLQFNYLRTWFAYGEDELLVHPFLQTLDENGLTSMSFSTVVFKPLDLDNFLLVQAGASLNGDYTLGEMQSLSHTRFFAAVIYGWKPNDRKMWGLGLSRTYIGGSLNYLPVFYYQYSSVDGQWGVDVLLPSRADLKRNFGRKNILSLGWNVQGNSYRLNALQDEEANLEPELRRSELRIRAIYDRAITNTLWFSLQGGLRYSWDFNADDGDFFRSFFSDDPYLFENEQGNPLFAQLSLRWVSP